MVSLVKGVQVGVCVENSGTGPVRMIAGKPVAKRVPVVPRGFVIRYSGGSAVARVTVGRSGSASVRMRNGDVHVIRASCASADLVANALEYRARAAGVYAGRRILL